MLFPVSKGSERQGAFPGQTQIVPSHSDLASLQFGGELGEPEMSFSLSPDIFLFAKHLNA